MNVDSFDDKPALSDSESGEQPKISGSSSSEKTTTDPGIEPAKETVLGQAKTADKLTGMDSPKSSGKGSGGAAGSVLGGGRNADKKPAGSGVSWLALLLSLVALSLSAWLWWQGANASRAPVDNGLAQLAALQSQLQKLETTVASIPFAGQVQSLPASDDVSPRLQALESALSAEENFRTESAAWSRSAQAALEDTQSRLAAIDERMRNLAARSAESSAELELDEIDYLLRLAPERLQLFGDTRAADRALVLADQQVQAFDNPMFIGLHREIAAARQSLAAADVPDQLVLGAEIDKLQALLANLAFKVPSSDLQPDTGAAPLSEDSFSWWERLKNSLSGLITVRRIDDAELAMPALADQQSLRQRAWLEVEQARLAALRREQDIYQDSLARAALTINRWFDGEDQGVRQALTSIAALQQRHVDPTMPDIGMPWTTLRSIRESGLSSVPVNTPAPLVNDSEGSAAPESQPSIDESRAGMNTSGEAATAGNRDEIPDPGPEQALESESGPESGPEPGSDPKLELESNADEHGLSQNGTDPDNRVRAQVRR